jgi:hypothetical protein
MITAIPGTKATVIDPETGQTVVLEVQAWDLHGFALVYSTKEGRLMRPSEMDPPKGTPDYYISPTTAAQQ